MERWSAASKSARADLLPDAGSLRSRNGYFCCLRIFGEAENKLSERSRRGGCRAGERAASMARARCVLRRAAAGFSRLRRRANRHPAKDLVIDLAARLRGMRHGERGQRANKQRQRREPAQSGSMTAEKSHEDIYGGRACGRQSRDCRSPAVAGISSSDVTEMLQEQRTEAQCRKNKSCAGKAVGGFLTLGNLLQRRIIQADAVACHGGKTLRGGLRL